MTIYTIANNVTVASANPTTIITPQPQVAGIILQPALVQMEVRGTSGSCTATAQLVGSLDNPNTLPPWGTGGQWINIGSALTVTASPAELGTGGAGTITTAVPYTSYGLIPQTLSGTGVVMNAKLQA